jgi:phage-related protein
LSAAYHTVNSPKPLFPTTREAQFGTLFNSTMQGDMQSLAEMINSSVGALQILKKKI